MKQSLKYPPNYEIISLAFPAIEKHTPIFCYGDTIFNPFRVSITPDLEFHESIHMRQQGSDPDSWWNRYCIDKDFRYEQELEAYSNQYAFAKKKGARGKLLDWIKEKCAQSFSSDLYNFGISYGEAESKIRQYAKSI